MQTLEAGSRSQAGFTLLELLVVVVIAALVAVGVGFALRDASQVQLEREGERLAALLESARARSRMSGVPVRWHATDSGFVFDTLVGDALPDQWLDRATGVAAPAGATQPVTLLLGPEPIIGPQEVRLHSRSEPGKTLRVASDGLRPFAVQAP